MVNGRANGAYPRLGVLLVGFSPVVRAGIRAILARDKGIEVVREVEDGADALDEIRRARDTEQSIQVVLTETRTTNLDGAQVTMVIKDEFPKMAVLVLVENPNDSYVIDVIQAGDGGYFFLTNTTPRDLPNGVRGVIEGRTQMKAALLRSAVEALIQNRRKTLAKLAAEAHLTEREVDVLRLLGNGDSNKVIAEALNITLDTTKKHIRRVIAKLRARSRTHAAVIAALAGTQDKPVLGATYPEAPTIPGRALRVLSAHRRTPASACSVQARAASPIDVSTRLAAAKESSIRAAQSEPAYDTVTEVLRRH